MRADRLLSILLLLQHRGRMTARELAGKLEVSVRTVHRDMDALSAAGIPIYAERGAGGGWVLEGGYQTRLTGLKREELQSLLLAGPSPALKALGLEHEYEAAFLKLLAALPSGVRGDAEYMRDRIHVDGAGWHDHPESFPYLSIAQEAIWQQRVMRIHYPKEGQVAERIIEPLGLVAKGRTWYLIASTRNEIRTFRVSRIVEAVMLGQTFVRPEDFQLAKYWEQSKLDFRAGLPSYPAVLRVRKLLFRQMNPGNYVKILGSRPADNEWVIVDVDLQTLEFGIGYVLGLGARAVVVEPRELRQAISSEAERVIQLYQTRIQQEKDADSV